jgi:hypothetical protein
MVEKNVPLFGAAAPLLSIAEALVIEVALTRGQRVLPVGT